MFKGVHRLSKGFSNEVCRPSKALKGVYRPSEGLLKGKYKTSKGFCSEYINSLTILKGVYRPSKGHLKGFYKSFKGLQRKYVQAIGKAHTLRISRNISDRCRKLA